VAPTVLVLKLKCKYWVRQYLSIGLKNIWQARSNAHKSVCRPHYIRYQIQLPRVLFQKFVNARKRPQLYSLSSVHIFKY